jgi:hypothetical protein
MLVNWLNHLYRTWRKRRAIRSYVRKLPGLLAKRYGYKRWYTPAQIRRTAEDYDLDTDYLCYAYATYADVADFVAFHTESGQSCSYEEMRGEVADHFFQGHSDFTTQDLFDDVLAHSHDAHGGFDSHHGGHGDSGHF